MHNCPDCKDKHKEYDEISSRISSLRWHAEDYDRTKGKGKFKKDHPDSVKVMDDLLSKKTKMLTAHMGHDIPAEKGLEHKPDSISVGVYHG